MRFQIRPAGYCSRWRYWSLGLSSRSRSAIGMSRNGPPWRRVNSPQHPNTPSKSHCRPTQLASTAGRTRTSSECESSLRESLKSWKSSFPPTEDRQVTRRPGSRVVAIDECQRRPQLRVRTYETGQCGADEHDPVRNPACLRLALRGSQDAEVNIQCVQDHVAFAVRRGECHEHDGLAVIGADVQNRSRGGASQLVELVSVFGSQPPRDRIDEV